MSNAHSPSTELLELADAVIHTSQEFSTPRPLTVIAREINGHYTKALLKKPGTTPAWVAWTKPYQQAMRELECITDTYGMETAHNIVLRFLANATSWRGDDARRIKAELQSHLDSCPAHKH